MNPLRWTFAVLACSAFITPASAEVTVTDLQVMARALSFMERAPSGVIDIGIVHVPSNPASLRQAREIQSTMGNGMRVGNLTMRPVLVPLGSAGNAGVDLFLLTEHLGPAATPLAAIAADRRMPCVTVDLEQVREGACVIGIRSRPRVEILVNRSAAGDSGVAFATAFRMMVTEL